MADDYPELVDIDVENMTTAQVDKLNDMIRLLTQVRVLLR